MNHNTKMRKFYYLSFFYLKSFILFINSESQQQKEKYHIILHEIKSNVKHIIKYIFRLMKNIEANFNIILSSFRDIFIIIFSNGKYMI